MIRGTPRLRRSAHGGTGRLLAGYVGVAGFFAVEVAARQRGGAASLNASHDDQGTTRGIVIASIPAVCVAPLFRRAPLGSLPSRTASSGLALQAVGLGLRLWSMRTLGASYSRTLRTEWEQPLVEDGPYRLVRHPGYAGSLLTWIGFALTSGSLPVVALGPWPMGPVARTATRNPRREGAGGSLPVVSGSIGEGREETTGMIVPISEPVLKTGSRRVSTCDPGRAGPTDGGARTGLPEAGPGPAPCRPHAYDSRP